MKIGAMIGDLIRSLARHPATQQYPTERRETPAALRGQLHFDPAACTGCGLCVMDCPARAIDLVTLDKKARRFVMRYHVDRCTFCGQCVESCRKECLSLSNSEWELAAASRESMLRSYGRKEDVDEVLAGDPDENSRAAGS